MINRSNSNTQRVKLNVQNRANNNLLTNSGCYGNLPTCILRLGENGMKKHRLAKKWEPLKIVNLLMDHPVCLKDGN